MSRLDIKGQVRLGRVDAINPSGDYPPGHEELEQGACEDHSLLHATCFWVGHLVTHNLIELNGTSEAFRVTLLPPAGAYLWVKGCLSTGLFAQFQVRLFLALH